MKALITGINGQDGSYLAELLLEKGYEVYGTIRRSTLENREKFSNIEHIKDKVKLLPCSLDNQLSIYKVVSQIKPDECYHLAASSFVSYLFEDEMSIISTNVNATHSLLASIKEIVPHCRFYFAGSSEMFGDAETVPQNEKTPFNPRSIYGISKLSSYFIVKNYREHHGIYACTGLTYNHESPRRGLSFVTRKITHGVARIHLGLAKELELGNLDTTRDWGYAYEYVNAMWLMLNNVNGPKDYVIATGIPHTVRDILQVAFQSVNLDYLDYVKSNRLFFRPKERVPLIGDAKKIGVDLNWRPIKKIEDVVIEMVSYDISLLKQQGEKIQQRN